MNKRIIRSLIIVGITILYSLIIHFFSFPLRDVEIEFTASEAEYNGAVMQLFWDDGSGFNAEDSIYAQIDQQKGSFTLTREMIDQVYSFRIDPIAEERNITFSAISINGKDISPQEFLSWVTTESEVECQADENEFLQFHPLSLDPQIYLGTEFISTLKEATTVSQENKHKLIVGGVIVALLLLFAKEITTFLQTIFRFCNKKIEKIYAGHSRRQTISALLGIAIISVLVFFDFLIGKRYFLFADVGDQYGQLYPQLIRNAKLIQKGILFGGFDFTVGLGSIIGSIKFDLTNWVSIFGEDHIAYLMGAGQFLKVFLSGLFFYFFMRVNGQKNWYCAILALGYAFCGHMTCRGFWASYPNEVLLVAIWLFCFELWFKRKDFRFIPLATVLFFYQFNSGYYLYLYLAFFTGYILFRYITEYHISWKKWLIALVVGIVGIGVGYLTMGEQMIYGITSALSSDRAQGNMEGLTWTASALLPNFTNWKLVFGKTIGLGTYGIIGSDYTDKYWNFIEDPTLYCGIFVLLLIPLAFYCMTWKKRIAYAIGYIGAMAICFCGQIRLLANGFAGSTYKLCTFWIIIFMLFTVAQIKWDAFENKRKQIIATIVLTITMAILLLGCYQLSLEADISHKYLKQSVWFLCIEFVMILFLVWGKNMHYLTRGVLLVVVGIEILLSAYPIYNDRITLDKDIYKDGTDTALSQIAEADDSFYRVDKQYLSVQYCDSLAQDYYGTAFYIGGFGVGPQLADFYNDMGLPIYSLNRSAWGTSSYNEVENLLGIKYALTKEGQIANYGFEYVNSIDGITVYENKKAMPMGFVYEKEIKRSTFERLPYNQRQRALLEAVLVEDDVDILPELSEDEVAALGEKESLFEKYEIEFQSAENYSFVFEPNTEEEMIAVMITFDSTGKSDLCYSTLDGASYHMPIHQVSGGQIFEINTSGVSRIWADSPNWANIMSLRIAKIPKSEYYETYDDIVDEQNKSAVNVSLSEDNHIVGEFYSEEGGILYLPIPANGGWQVYLDDEWQNVLVVNDAFIGIPVSKGTHTIKLWNWGTTFWGAYKKNIIWLAICVTIIVIGTVWKKKKARK